MGQGPFNAPRAVPTDTEPEPEDGLQLSTTERTELQQHEDTIERGLKTFQEVGTALMAIRDGRLYREKYGTFEDYCRERWGMSRIHAHRYIEAAEVVGNLLPMGNILPAVERQARPLSRLEPDAQREAWRAAVETAPNGKITAAHVARVADELYPRSPRPTEDPHEDVSTAHEGESVADPIVLLPRPLASHQLINQSTNNEWYTPAPYIEAVREVLGGIDTDPASNPFANQTIRATTYYTAEQDGFSKPWVGRVFLNPPYGFGDDNESNQARWSKRLIEQFQSGITTEAILLVNAVPGNKWFAPLWNYTICFPDHRIRFYNEAVEAGQPTHSNAFIYFGPNRDTFARVFARFGVVAVRYEVPDAAV